MIQHDGETYRLGLQWLAQEKGVESQVIFYNRFVSLEELIEFIGAADIYICRSANTFRIVGRATGLATRYCGPFPTPRRR